MDESTFAERADYTMRAPCRFCSAKGIENVAGYISRKSGQDCVYCVLCGTHQYNAPRHERGLAPTPVRSDGISPSVRYFVMDRARRRCEFCGCGPFADGVEMHVGHLLSQDDCRRATIPLAFSDHVDNLAWLCPSCNLGMGKTSLALHDLLILLIQRALVTDRSA